MIEKNLNLTKSLNKLRNKFELKLYNIKNKNRKMKNLWKIRIINMKKNIGALNQFDRFECLDCKTNFQVENFYKIENMKVVFDRYGEIEELN